MSTDWSQKISSFTYSGGRGKGVLGLLHEGEKRPTKRDKYDENYHSKKLLVMYDYKGNPDQPGGFPELSVTKGEQLVYIREHPDNEHWWEATNSEGHSGYVPSSYVILKDDQSLPWLEQKALMEREKERKERALRHVQQQEMTEGKGFGPPPKQTDKPYTYVSAYNRQPASSTSSSGTVTSYYCDVCEKSFNGPKPYKAHMLSKAHKEELQLRQEEEEQSYN